MSYVHEKSKQCGKTETDLFTIPPTQASLEKGRWIDYHPLSSVENDDGPITFLAAGTEDYVDLSKTILFVEGKVVKADGTNLGGDEQSNVAPVNNFLHSLFKQVDVYLNGKQVTPAMGTYPYRAYLETLLNYDVSAKESQLTSAMYYKDTAGEMESTGSLPSEKTITYATGVKSGQNLTTSTFKLPLPGSGNQGFAKRHQFIQNGKKFTLSGPIFVDAFMGSRLLLNLVDLKLILNRSSDQFCLMDKNGSPLNAKVKLTDVILKVRKVRVSPTVSMAHELALKKMAAIYPIRRVECKTFVMPANIPNVRKDNIFTGIIPKTFVFGLLDAKGFSGDYKKNPYNFQDYKVTTVTLTANGEELPFKQLTLNYKNNKENFIQAYNTLFSGTGKMNYNTGLDISREDYPKGYTLYAFDLTPDMCGASPYFNTVQRGSLTVDITFADAPSIQDGNPTAIAMICYGDFENVIQIDSERNVIYDMSS